MLEPDDVTALVARAVETFGRVDVAVNNAATNPHFGPLLTAEEWQWDKILDTNVKSVFRVCKAVAPHMEAQGGGKIINVASIAGLRPSGGMGGGKCPLELAGYNISLMPIARVARGQLLGWPPEMLQKSVPNA